MTYIALTLFVIVLFLSKRLLLNGDEIDPQ